MSHPREEWLALEATGDLSWWRSALLRRHLAACSECAAQVREFAAISAELRNLDAPEFPSGLPAQVLAAISLQDDSSVRRAKPAWAWISVSAVAALALLVVGYELPAPGPSPTAVNVRPTTAQVPVPVPQPAAEEPAKESGAAPAATLAVYTDLGAAEAARDKAYLASLAAHQTGQVKDVLARWTEAADQQQRVKLRPLAGPRAEILRTHSLPGRVEIVQLAGAPLQIVSAQASFAEGRLIDPSVEVRNAGGAPVKGFQLVWVFRDASGAEYFGRSSPVRRAVGPSEHVLVAENLALETSRTGPDSEIVSARVFLRSAEFSDARVWVPERKSLEAHNVGQFLPLPKGTQDLLASYRQHGMQALLAQLSPR